MGPTAALRAHTKPQRVLATTASLLDRIGCPIVDRHGTPLTVSLTSGNRHTVTGRSPTPRSPAALATLFKLVESARARWRAITGAHLVPLVRAGAHFENGILVERSQVAA